MWNKYTHNPDDYSARHEAAKVEGVAREYRRYLRALKTLRAATDEAITKTEDALRSFDRTGRDVYRAKTPPSITNEATEAAHALGSLTNGLRRAQG